MRCAMAMSPFGAARSYHGVLALKEGEHPIVGRMRLNLTIRGAL